MKATIRAGCGYYDVSRFPIGGDFHRASQEIPLINPTLAENHGPQRTGQPSKVVLGTDAKGRRLAASVSICTIEEDAQ